jgi:hypothetical protein
VLKHADRAARCDCTGSRNVVSVNEPAAETVRSIFRSYLKHGSLNLLMADLRKRGLVTAGIDDFDVARSLKAKIALRQGARLVDKYASANSL